jgi:hypothetical protein
MCDKRNKRICAEIGCLGNSSPSASDIRYLVSGIQPAIRTPLIFLTLSISFIPLVLYINNKKFILNLNLQMLHTLLKNIIPGDHNNMKAMQSSLTGETNSSINSGLKKMLMIFSLTFLGTIKYLALSCILF